MTTYKEEVDAFFSDLVSTYNLKRGDVLPSERDLYKSVGIGRSAVRDYIKVYSYLGRVLIQHGKQTIWLGE